MQDIKAWMETVKLKLNEAETEFIYFGSRQQLNKQSLAQYLSQENESKDQPKVRYLGGHLDSNLTLKEHILIECKAATL